MSARSRHAPWWQADPLHQYKVERAAYVRQGVARLASVGLVAAPISFFWALAEYEAGEMCGGELAQYAIHACERQPIEDVVKDLADWPKVLECFIEDARRWAEWDGDDSRFITVGKGRPLPIPSRPSPALRVRLAAWLKEHAK